MEPKQNQKKPDVIKEKLKENKAFFYGFPIFVVISIFGSLLFVILPTVRYFFTSNRENAAVEQNTKNVNQSIRNLRSAYSESSLITEYDTRLSEYVPKEPKLGEVINLIQKKADDFSLERKVTVGGDQNNTSLDNLATTDQNQEAVFQSISSGEIEFQPKSLGTDAKAVLLSIEVNIRGKKDSFLNFLKDMDKVRPLINLVSIDYSESDPDNPADTSVNAVLRFESYAIDIRNDANAVSARRITKDDAILIGNIAVENFNWDKSIGDNLE